MREKATEWRKGRKCATCAHWCMDDLQCCAENPGVGTPTYPGFDEDDPHMIIPLDCWDEADEEIKSEIALAYREGAIPKNASCPCCHIEYLSGGIMRCLDCGRTYQLEKVNDDE